MIAPAYRRQQLWAPARRRRAPALAFGLVLGFVVAFTVAAPRTLLGGFRATPEATAKVLVLKLARESFPEWREHHTGCPHRLADLLPGTHLDPWRHAMHYTCDPRLAHGRFAVTSAGEDGVFGTADDIEDHE